jgi:hypothetical protein
MGPPFFVGMSSPTIDQNQKKAAHKYKQRLKNKSNKWLGPFKGLHEVVIETK